MHEQHAAAIWRVAVYAREAPGRGNRVRLDSRVARLASEVARRGGRHVATYAELSLGRPWTRPGLCRLLADAPWAFDLAVVDGYGQLSTTTTTTSAASSAPSTAWGYARRCSVPRLAAGSSLSPPPPRSPT